ncbi:hypothetical protein [Novosphingobium naphthalenivorans]|uniref:hypothetical protein n=1 Tax=Novosphingobium naphthalenivorans TaxID=273168 RepID=UPI0012ED5296|nr:hypothetical protein [Novosphingobium naphthalenivorans]
MSVEQSSAYSVLVAQMQQENEKIERQTNMNAALDSIIRADSKHWWMNEYVLGSVRDSYIRWQSNDGRTVIIRANYTYNYSSKGWVEAKLTDNRLVCIEYWDSDCRAPYDANTTNERANVIAGVVVAAVALALIANSSSDGGNSGASGQNSGGSSSFDPTAGRASAQPSSPPTPKPDTSVGCAWGDRAYGTCH